MALDARQLFEEDLIGHPHRYDPVFDCVAFALDLEEQGYEDGLSLTSSVQSVDWDYFAVIYKQYRENINKYKRDQYKLEHGLPKKKRIRLKVCPQCHSYFYKEGNRRKIKYCSRSCYDSTRIKKREHKQCAVCGDNFYNAHRKKAECCSTKCALVKGKRTTELKQGRSVFQICKISGARLEKFKTMREASDKTGANRGSISNACKNGRLAGGYRWEYSNDVDPDTTEENKDGQKT